MQACLNAFSNFVAADQCQAAFTASPAPIAVAVAVAAVFATLTYRAL